MPISNCQDLSIAVNISINTVVTTVTPLSLQVKSGSSNCTVKNLIKLANICQEVRLPTLRLLKEAYNEMLALLMSGGCGPGHDQVWLAKAKSDT